MNEPLPSAALISRLRRSCWQHAKALLQPTCASLTGGRARPYCCVCAEKVCKAPVAHVSQSVCRADRAYISLSAVFDVTDGRIFYGRDGCYNVLVGSDASRLLAKGILEPESAAEELRPLAPHELKDLRRWQEHYRQNYRRLGTLATETQVGSSAARTVESIGHSLGDWRAVT